MNHKTAEQKHQLLNEQLSGTSDGVARLDLIITFCRNNYNTIQKDTLFFVKAGLKIANKYNKKLERDILKTYLSFYLLHHEQRKKATSICNSILPGLLKNRCYSEYGLSVIILSQIQWAQGNFENAYNIVYKALDQVKFKRNKNNALIRLHWVLAGFALDLNEIDESYQHYTISNKFCQEETDLGMISYVKIGLASIYKLKGDFSRAVELFEEALSASQKNNLWLVESRAYYEIGMIHILQGNAIEAENLIFKSYTIRKENNALPALVSSLSSLAEIDFSKGEFKKAKKKLMEAYTICSEKNLKSKMAKVLSLLAKIAEANSEFETALNYYKKHTQLEKEIIKVEVENRHQYLKLNYKAKKTEQDIQLQRLTNRNLKSALDKEKELNDLKNRFVSVTSHQFRTPMAIIQSNTDLVNMIIQNSESKQKTQLEKANRRIQKEIYTMVNLMDDILILGKINSGKILSVNPVSTDLESFCMNIISGFNTLQKDNRKLVLKISGEVKVAMSDRSLLKHILSNLLSNAFKYSTVEDPIFDLVFEKDKFVISVIDKGIGIPEQDLPNLFQPFHRATNVGEISGTGLGLSIAKEYIDLLNGSLTVHSVLNKGTTIVLSLPYD